jgi:hypothetical protein
MRRSGVLPANAAALFGPSSRIITTTFVQVCAMLVGLVVAECSGTYIFHVFADTRMIGCLLLVVDALLRRQPRRRQTAQSSAHEDARQGNLSVIKQRALLGRTTRIRSQSGTRPHPAIVPAAERAVQFVLEFETGAPSHVFVCSTPLPRPFMILHRKRSLQ